MSVAVAQVKQIITIQGVDNASATVAKAQASLKGLEGSVGRAAEKAGDLQRGFGGIDATKIQSTTQRAGGALSALAGAAGPAATGLAEIGREASGLGATAAVLPGPLGLVAAAIVGVGAGAYFLAKAANEAQAKMRLLVSTEGGALAKSLDLGTDAAIKLSATMGDLGEKAVRPTNALLQQVAKNAKDLGLEPVDSIAKFIAAWKDGPEAVAKVQREIGNLGVALRSVPELAKSLGLDPKSLGLEQSVATVERLKAGLADAAKLEANKSAAETAVRVATAAAAVAASKRDELASTEASSASEAIRIAAQLKAATESERSLSAQAAAQTAIVKTLETQIESEKQAATFRAKKVETENSTAAIGKKLADEVTAGEIKAGNAKDKTAATAARLESLTRQQKILIDQIAAEQKLITAGTGDEAVNRKKSLEITLSQKKTQEKALLDADKAERKAKAKENADADRADRGARSEASIGLLKAQIDADGEQSAAERLRLIDAEQAKELQAVSSSTASKKTKAVQVAKIEQETANKIRAIAVDETAAAAKKADDQAKEQQDEADASIDLARKADDATAASAKSASALKAATLRELGNEDAAILIERAQADAEYNAAIRENANETLNVKIGAFTKETDIANAQRIQRTKDTDAAQTLAAFNSKTSKDAQDRLKNDIAATADAVKGPAQLLAQLGASNSKLGAGLGAAADGVSKVSKNWKGLKASAPDAISASGEVAAAFVDDERTKAGILAISETAAALASFENPAAAAAHAAAALLYGGIALGVVGSGGGESGGGAASGGGFANTAPTGGISTAAPVGGGNVTINFNQPLVTKQEVGKVVQNALRSIGQTGMAKAKGV